MHTGLHGFSWFVCKHTVLMGQASAAVCVSGFMRCFRDSTVYHFDVDVGDFTRPRTDRQVDSRRPAASRSARSVSQARHHRDDGCGAIRASLFKGASSNGREGTKDGEEGRGGDLPTSKARGGREGREERGGKG